MLQNSQNKTEVIKIAAIQLHDVYYEQVVF